MASQAGNSDTRKNIKVQPETYRALNDARGNQKWDDFLNKLLDEVPVEREYTDIPDERVREIAERTAEEIETRLR